MPSCLVSPFHDPHDVVVHLFEGTLVGCGAHVDALHTLADEPEVTVDHIEVAQFVYLLMHNEKIRDAIDTVGKKGVLLLGRFTGGRIAVGRGRRCVREAGTGGSSRRAGPGLQMTVRCSPRASTGLMSNTVSAVFCTVRLTCVVFSAVPTSAPAIIQI